jgi:hypothetical protein
VARRSSLSTITWASPSSVNRRTPVKVDPAAIGIMQGRNFTATAAASSIARHR